MGILTGLLGILAGISGRYQRLKVEGFGVEHIDCLAVAQVYFSPKSSIPSIKSSKPTNNSRYTEFLLETNCS